METQTLCRQECVRNQEFKMLSATLLFISCAQRNYWCQRQRSPVSWSSLRNLIKPGGREKENMRQGQPKKRQSHSFPCWDASNEYQMYESLQEVPGSRRKTYRAQLARGKRPWCYESLIHERHERHVACVVKLFDDLLLCPQTEPCWETCEASDIFRMRIWSVGICGAMLRVLMLHVVREYKGMLFAFGVGHRVFATSTLLNMWKPTIRLPSLQMFGTLTIFLLPARSANRNLRISKTSWKSRQRVGAKKVSRCLKSL